MLCFGIMTVMRIRFAAMGCALLIVAACGGGGGGGGGSYGLDSRASVSGLQIPIDASGGAGEVALVDAFPNFKVPNATFITGARDGTNRLFVTFKNGRIIVFANNSASASPSGYFLDISDRVDDSTGESGLFGLAFDPAFASNGYFYVTYSSKRTPRTVRLSQFRVTPPGGNTASASSERIVFEYDHSEPAHFGGWIGFGPEANTLYMSTGDNVEGQVAQNNGSLFGKILRMRINAANATYSVPQDNPFGNNNLVWALGFRNPWRCSFDRAGNGNLWCGDVGQATREEVSLVRRGSNHGWPFFEGSLAYDQPGTRNYSDFAAPD
jgi:glucose/arabinose dehydrogenase